MNITLLGIPIFAYGGMLVGLLIVIQVLGGFKVIKMPLIWHKRLAIIILIFGAIHGFLALLYLLTR